MNPFQLSRNTTLLSDAVTEKAVEFACERFRRDTITQVNASHLVLTQYDLVTMSDATLHEIISHIETTFGVRLSVPGRYGDKRYTFNYQRSNSLEEVLNIVEYLTGEHCEVIYRKK